MAEGTKRSGAGCWGGLLWLVCVGGAGKLGQAWFGWSTIAGGAIFLVVSLFVLGLVQAGRKQAAAEELRRERARAASAFAALVAKRDAEQRWP